MFSNYCEMIKKIVQGWFKKKLIIYIFYPDIVSTDGDNMVLFFIFDILQMGIGIFFPDVI